jgi:hypothetical protein
MMLSTRVVSLDSKSLIDYGPLPSYSQRTSLSDAVEAYQLLSWPMSPPHRLTATRRRESLPEGVPPSGLHSTRPEPFQMDKELSSFSRVQSFVFEAEQADG